MDNPLVTVVGPHGRHIQVHQSTQKALPTAFPLPSPPKRKPPKTSRPAKPNTATEQDSTTSEAPAEESDTVETTKEAH